MTKKKTKARKTRSWLAVHAHFKTGAGPHGVDAKKKPKYSRRVKHKGRNRYD